MSYHIVSIDAPLCDISESKGQLLVRDDTDERRIPMEDVATVIITSLKATLSSTFLNVAAQHGIPVILCHLYKPCSILLPADRTTDTLLLRHLADLPVQTKQRLWEKTLSAKCANQHYLAAQWAPGHPLLPAMSRLAATGHEYREGEVARYFWTIFGETFAPDEFSRGRRKGSYNPLFNYAYAVLLSCVLRYLYAHGIEPTFGIHHMARAHATPLAYDLMEPFRPAFDAAVARWIRQEREKGCSETQIQTVSKAYRAHILNTLLAETDYGGASVTLRNSIESVLRSFKASVTHQQVRMYQPWKMSGIKWVG